MTDAQKAIANKMVTNELFIRISQTGSTRGQLDYAAIKTLSGEDVVLPTFQHGRPNSLAVMPMIRKDILVHEPELSTPFHNVYSINEEVCQ